MSLPAHKVGGGAGRRVNSGHQLCERALQVSYNLSEFFMVSTTTEGQTNRTHRQTATVAKGLSKSVNPEPKSQQQHRQQLQQSSVAQISQVHETTTTVRKIRGFASVQIE